MSVKIADKIVQMNNQDYVLMDSHAIEYVRPDGTTYRVDELLRKLTYEAPQLSITADQVNYQSGDVVDITFNITIKAGNEKIKEVWINSWLSGVQDITDFSENGTTNTTVTFTGVSQSDAYSLYVKDELNTNSKSLTIKFASLSYTMLIGGDSSFDNYNYTMDDLFAYANTVNNLPLDSKEYKWYIGRDINSEYVVYAYPKSYGELEVITDGGMNYISGFNRSEKTYNGVEYYCYVSKTISSLTDTGKLFMEFK